MSDMFKMMKQAASMRKDIKRMQKDLAALSVDYTKGGITATARGDGSLAGIKIDPKLVEAGDVARLEKAVVTAVEGALDEARKKAAKQMSSMTGGLGGALSGLMP